MATTAWTSTVPVSTSWNIVTFPSTFEGFTIINQGPDEVYVYCNPPAGFSEQVYHVSIHGGTVNPHIFYGIPLTGVALQSTGSCTIDLKQVRDVTPATLATYSGSHNHNMSALVEEDITDSIAEAFPDGGNTGQFLGIVSTPPRVLGWETATGSGGSGVWGGITGTLSNQTDLWSALGLLSPIANPTFTGVVTAPRYTSTIPVGTAPFTVTSTTPVANLSIGGNSATSSDGLSSASGTAPLTLTLNSKALTGSVSAFSSSASGVVPLSGGGTTNFLRADGSWSAPPGGAGHTIEDEGTPLTSRTYLNFVGAGVVATDNAGNDSTVVTITGASILEVQVFS